MKAYWNNQIIAESADTIIIEGNHYFPPQSIKTEFFSISDTHTTCPWKGVASYYNIEVEGRPNADAAWFYPQTKPLADKIEGYVAFWKGVEIKED